MVAASAACAESSDAVAAAPSAPAAASPAAAPSASNFNLTLGALSDYRYDGISYSNRHATWQARALYASPLGVYGGVQASGVDFLDQPRTRVETAFLAGWDIPVMKNSDLDLQVDYTVYPDQRSKPSWNYFDATAVLNHHFRRLTLSGEFDWSPTYPLFGQIRGATLGVEYAATDWLSVSGHVGRWWVSQSADYFAWDAGATAKWKRLALDVRYGGTDLHDSNCGYTKWCEPGFSTALSVRVWP